MAKYTDYNGIVWLWRKMLGRFKTRQTAVSDPTASSTTSTTFIDSISQDANGKITATKKTVAGSTDTKVTSAANHYGYSENSGKTSGLYKIATDDAGHITEATAVAKSDITALGIPGSDTNTHNSHALTVTNNQATPQSQGTTITYVESVTGCSATSGNLTASTTRKSITVPANTDTKVTSAANHYGYTSGSGKSSGLYKITTDDAGHVTGATAVAKSDITALGIPGSDTNTDTKVTSAANHYGYSSGSGKSSGLYKITTDDAGHVTAATAVSKSDITALGIPGSDTNTDTKVTSAANHYTPSSESYTPTSGTYSWGTTELVSGITKDSKGHIVGVTTVKIDNPNTNTDTKVTQTASSGNANYEVLFSATADNTTRTETARKCSSIKANPSTGALTAKKFVITSGTNAQFLMADGSTKTLSAVTGSAVPIGTIVMWPTANAPTGWLICNGQSITGDAYADLRTVLGGATTVPNLTGRFPLGVGESTATGHTNHTLGSTGGEEKHTLSTAEMPSHKHTILHGGSGSIKYEGVAFASQSTESTYGNGNSAGYPIIGATGSSTAHNNMPPFYTLNFIIKYA